MLSLTRKTDYALLALTRLAGQPGEIVSAREIAERVGVSLPLLMNVLKQLASAGLVSSVRGAHGGYSLARPAEEITLAELIDATEGPMRLAPCVATHRNSSVAVGCDSEAHCPMYAPFMWLHEKMRGFLEGISLAELVAAGANRAVKEL